MSNFVDGCEVRTHVPFGLTPETSALDHTAICCTNECRARNKVRNSNHSVCKPMHTSLLHPRVCRSKNRTRDSSVCRKILHLLLLHDWCRTGTRHEFRTTLHQHREERNERDSNAGLKPDLPPFQCAQRERSEDSYASFPNHCFSAFEGTPGQLSPPTQDKMQITSCPVLGTLQQENRIKFKKTSCT